MEAEFHLILSGMGDTIEECWDNAIETFANNPGNPDDEQIKVIDLSTSKLIEEDNNISILL